MASKRTVCSSREKFEHNPCCVSSGMDCYLGSWLKLREGPGAITVLDGITCSEAGPEMKEQPNHAITLGSFTGGHVWVQDENGNSPAEVDMKSGVRSLIGTWYDIHDKPITFNARRFHQLEPHEGHMWALAAYTPQAFKHAWDDFAFFI